MAKTAKKQKLKAPPAERVDVIEKQTPTSAIQIHKTKVKQCAYCKHFYMKPCDDKAKDKCPNFLFIQQKINKGKEKAKRK